jgi:hypothetical protein
MIWENDHEYLAGNTGAVEYSGISLNEEQRYEISGSHGS